LPVSGSTGYVNIGGRIVPLSSTSAVLPTGAPIDTTIVTSSISTAVTTLTTTSGIITGSIGTTNGTGIGVTTTGGTGTGGVNVGPQESIVDLTANLVPINIGDNTNELDSGNTIQSLFPTDINQISLRGLDELNISQLEQLPLELTTEPVPSLSNQANLYRGFRFQIKEEQDPRFVVRGTIKRRYAVAINRQGIEVLKSEYSFTLDPNDLVDQLKLIIDKQNLQG
jgi:hypothetical protein